MTGEVRLRFEPGACTVVGRRSAALALRPVARHLRQRRRVRPVARRGVRAAVRAAAQGVVGQAGRRVTSAMRRGPRSTASRSGPAASRRRRRPRPRPWAGASVRRAARGAGRRVSTAHVRALEDAGLLTAEEAAELDGGADGGRAPRSREGLFAFDPPDEDVHSAIERAVTDRLGRPGGEAARRPQPQRPRGHRPAAVAPRCGAGGSTDGLAMLVGRSSRAHASTPRP